MTRLNQVLRLGIASWLAVVLATCVFVGVDSLNPMLPTPDPPMQGSNDFKDILRSMNPFTERMLDKVHDFTVFSPFGLFSTLAVVYNVVNENSPSFLELNENLNMAVVDLRPQTLDALKENYTLSGLHIVDYFFKKAPTPDLRQEFQNILTESDTLVVSKPWEMPILLAMKTGWRTDKLPYKVSNKFAVFGNVFSAHLKLSHEFVREEDQEQFLTKENDPNPVNTNFIFFPHDVKAVYDEALSIEIYSLPLDPELGKIAAYVIYRSNSFEKIPNIFNMTKDIHFRFNSLNPFETLFSIPPFYLADAHQFDQSHFPNLFQSNNLDFSRRFPSQPLGFDILQTVRLCLDESRDSREPAANGGTLFIHQPPFKRINHPFYIAVVDKSTSAPLAIGYVDKVLEGTSQCLDS